MTDGLDQAAQTSVEHAAAAAAAAGGGRVRIRPSRPAVLRPDAPEGHCANCETALQGPVCHACGQVDDEYHRPVRGLAAEILEGVFALDGRVARTIPALLIWPGRITRDFLKGKRARYMPPFRLYIIASLIFFLLVPLSGNLGSMVNDVREGYDNYDAEAAAGFEQARRAIDQQVADGTLSEEEAEAAFRVFDALPLPTAAAPDDPEAVVLTPMGEKTPDSEPAPDAAEAAEKTPDPDFSLPEVDAGSVAASDKAPSPDTDADAGSALTAPIVITGESDITDAAGDALRLNGSGDGIRRFFAPEDFGEAAPQTLWPLGMRRYIGERFAHVAEDPGDWLESAADWVPRVMFAMVPVYALLLGLTYVWRRGFYLYDHMIVSLHFHAALFLSMAILSKASLFIGAGAATLVMIVYSNLYLYKLHRTVYERGRFQSAVRTVTLTIAYGFVLLLGLVAVFMLGALAG